MDQASNTQLLTQASNNLTGNSNQICTPPPKNEGAGICEGSPHKLYNNFSNLGSGNITIGQTEKVSQNSRMEEIGAL